MAAARRWCCATGAGRSGDLLDACTRDPRLRAILTAQNGTYAIAPARSSAVLHAGLQNHYFVSGGWYPAGGAQVIADRLAEAIEAAGGDIRLRSRVTRIHVADGRVTGVTFENKHLGTTRVAAPVVISNADLKRTVLELVGAEHFPAAWTQRVAGFEMALPALRRLPRARHPARAIALRQRQSLVVRRLRLRRRLRRR